MTKLSTLKTEAYELTGLKSTPSLKRCFDGIKALDMRRKYSWHEAIRIIKEYLANEDDEPISSEPHQYVKTHCKELGAMFGWSIEKTELVTQEVIAGSNARRAARDAREFAEMTPEDQAKYAKYFGVPGAA